MRRFFRAVRGVAVVSVLVVAVGASAAPRYESRRDLPREKGDPVSKLVRLVTKVIRGLGDGMGGPTP